MNDNNSHSGWAGPAAVAGGGLLMVLCCAGPVLIAGGALRSPWLIGAAALLVVAAVGYTARPRRPVLAAAFTAVAATVLAACNTAPNTAAPTAASTSQPDATTITTLAGTTVRVPGDKPTAVFFFSVGCGECLGGGKSLAQAAAAVGDKAQFLAVDMDPSETKDAITGFLHTINDPNLPAAIDTGARLTRAYQVSALSTLIVVNPAGKVTYRGTDPNPDQIRTALGAAGAQ